jgi:hypothetical protein
MGMFWSDLVAPGPIYRNSVVLLVACVIAHETDRKSTR